MYLRYVTWRRIGEYPKDIEDNKLWASTAATYSLKVQWEIYEAPIGFNINMNTSTSSQKTIFGQFAHFSEATTITLIIRGHTTLEDSWKFFYIQPVPTTLP